MGGKWHDMLSRHQKRIAPAGSWQVPAWVGNGSFFSSDNVFYQTQFATCVKETLGFSLDYLGIWVSRQMVPATMLANNARFSIE